MTAAQYRAAIKKVGLSQRAAAKFFGVNERTSRRWAKDGAPRYVKIHLDWILKAPNPKGFVKALHSTWENVDLLINLRSRRP